MSEQFNETRLKEEREAEIMGWAKEDAINLSNDRFDPYVQAELQEANADAEIFGEITEEEMLETGLLMRNITEEGDKTLYTTFFKLAIKTNSPLPGKSSRDFIN